MVRAPTSEHGKSCGAADHAPRIAPVLLLPHEMCLVHGTVASCDPMVECLYTGYGKKEPEPEPKLSGLSELLTENKLEHIEGMLGDATLQSLFDESTANRVEFLSGLKGKGVDKLPDRQKLTNALGKAKRLDRF